MKRLWLALITLVLGCSLVAACSSSGGDNADSAESAGKVSLSWWTWWPQAPELAAAWNKTHADIQIKVEDVGGGAEQSAKLAAAIKAGQGPDIALAEYEILPQYLAEGIAMDISKYTSQLKSLYPPSVWSLVALNNGVYGVPADQGPMIMMFRPDLFAKYGLTVPTTWQEFATDAKIIHTKNPNAYIADFNPTDGEFFAGLARQAGAQWYQNDNGTWSVGINDAASKAVASFWNNLISEGLVWTQPTGTPAYYKMIAQNDLLTIPGGSWNTATPGTAATAPNEIGKWRVGPLPQWTAGDPMVSFAGGSSNIVTTTSKYPEQAAEFLSWLGTSTAGTTALVKIQGILPGSLPGQQVFKTIPVPQNYLPAGQANYGQVLLSASSNTSNVTWGPNSETAFTDYSDAVFAAVTNKTSLVNALNTVQQQVVSNLESSGYKVK
jgi:multiple sugar transport system substrate-binding protein